MSAPVIAARQPLIHLSSPVTLYETGFGELARVRAALNLVAGIADLMPMFSGGRKIHAREGSAWIGRRSVYPSGLPVVTAGAVLRHCPFGLAAGIRNASFFSDSPDPGEFALLERCELLDQISGRIAVMGALWRADDLSGCSITRQLWPALLESALERFEPDWVVGLIRGGRHATLGFEVEGFRHFWEGVTYRHPDWNGGYQVEDFVLCAMTRAEAARIVAATYPPTGSGSPADLADAPASPGELPR